MTRHNIIKGKRGGCKSEAKAFMELTKEFSEWGPQYVPMTKEVRPWGTNSFAIWLKNGLVYKAKRYAPGKFIMQPLTEEDIKKKYGEIQ